MNPPADMIAALAELYGCTPAELEVDPAERHKGMRVHEAILLAKSLPEDAVDRWLEIGRLLKPEKRDDG